MPGSEWNDDIVALYAVGNRIWARTSTVDEKKGILFFRETTPDELIEIAGYRVVVNSKRAGSGK